MSFGKPVGAESGSRQSRYRSSGLQAGVPFRRPGDRRYDVVPRGNKAVSRVLRDFDGTLEPNKPYRPPGSHGLTEYSQFPHFPGESRHPLDIISDFIQSGHAMSSGLIEKLHRASAFTRTY